MNTTQKDRSAYMKKYREDNAERRREYNARHYRDNLKTYMEYARQRAALHGSAVATWKLERGCADCGYVQDPVALDFDHVRGDKIKNVSLMLRGRIEPLLEEIDKCEVVCANCHRIRTRTRD